jgi:hypothetical protein
LFSRQGTWRLFGRSRLDEGLAPLWRLPSMPTLRWLLEAAFAIGAKVGVQVMPGG